jgi:adenylosuccinate lyase
LPVNKYKNSENDLNHEIFPGKMSNIWSAENRYKKWLDIEICACEAMAGRGVIPLAP